MRFFYIIFLFIAQSLQIANSQVLDSAFYSWRIYEKQETEMDEKICYIVSNPINSTSDHINRDLAYIMIKRYQNKRKEEVFLYSGFQYKINGKVIIGVDDFNMELSTNDEKAFILNKYQNVDIIQRMLRSSIIKARSDSAFGTFAIDEYSTKGIAKAYSRMRAICR